MLQVYTHNGIVFPIELIRQKFTFSSKNLVNCTFYYMNAVDIYLFFDIYSTYYPVKKDFIIVPPFLFRYKEAYSVHLI